MIPLHPHRRDIDAAKALAERLDRMPMVHASIEAFGTSRYEIDRAHEVLAVAYEDGHASMLRAFLVRQEAAETIASALPPRPTWEARVAATLRRIRQYFVAGCYGINPRLVDPATGKPVHGAVPIEEERAYRAWAANRL